MDLITLKHLIGFIILAIAAYEIAKYLQKKIHFPLITGLILTGIIVGSSLLDFLHGESLKNLQFLNDTALSIIAFSAGAELHLKELKSRINSIKWMTISQLFITFTLSSIFIFFISEHIHFMNELTTSHKIAIAILFGTIFIARSPSSAIAIINEMRARGDFTKTVMGVTVVTDVLVIILFAITFAISKNIVHNESINFLFFIILILEILSSFGAGYLVGKIIQFIFKRHLHFNIKAFFVLFIGYSIYYISHFVEIYSFKLTKHHFVLEPLLIAIIASFVITNYTSFRNEFEEILEKISPYIFIVFFTLIGASLSLQVLLSVFTIAIILFLIRALTMFIAGIIGVKLAKDSKEYTYVAWMPYLTQAGVAIGLATIIAHEFPSWGREFETMIIAIIVINQIVGPPLFKWVIKYVKESHLHHENHANEDKVYNALIFSLDSTSIELAKQLQKHNWNVKIVTSLKEYDVKNIEIIQIENYKIENIKNIPMKDCDSVLLLHPKEEINYEIGEWIYENIGTKNLIASTRTGEYLEKFKNIDVLTIQPKLAMISLMDHMVRSRNAITLLLGLDEDKDMIDIELKNKDLEGLLIREMSLPSDVSILSIKRKGNTIISHGYTMLRIGDILTVIGPEDELENLVNKFEA